MATATVAINGTGITWGGPWADVTNSSPQRKFTFNPSSVSLTFVGTTLECQCQQIGANPVTVSIDGGATTMPTLSTTFGYQTIASGLTDASHTAVIAQAIATPSGTLSIDRANSFRVTGSTPSFTWYPGLGTYYNLDHTFTDILGTNGYANIASYVRTEGLWSTSGGTLVSSQNDSAFRFRAAITDFSLFSAGTAHQAYALYDCSTRPATVVGTTTLTNNGYVWHSIATGLDGGTVKEYVLYCCENSNSNTPVYATLAFTVCFAGGTGIYTGATLPTLNTWAFYGDSITEGLSGTGFNSQTAFSQQLGITFHAIVQNLGYIGRTVHNFGSGGYGNSNGSGEGTDGLALVTSLSPAADRIIIAMGTNDMGNGRGETTAQFLTSYTNMLNGLLAGNSTAQIYCFSILNRAGWTQATIDTWDAVIVASIAACNAPGRVNYTNMSGVLTNLTNGVQTADGLHPNTVGYNLMLNRMRSVFLLGARAGSLSGGIDDQQNPLT